MIDCKYIISLYFKMENQTLEEQAKTIVMEKFLKLTKKYPDKHWDWFWIYNKNPNITMEIIKKYPDEPWNFIGFSINKNIKKAPGKPYNWRVITTGINLTMNFIDEYIDKNKDEDLDLTWISFNPNLTMEMIDKYPDKPWNWKIISSHPNLTIEMIDKYSDKPWDWKWGISRHTFVKDYEIELNKLALPVIKNNIKT